MSTSLNSGVEDHGAGRISPGEMVALVAAPPAAVARLAERVRAVAPELLVVDGTTPGATADLAGLRELPAGRRARLGIAVLVVTDDPVAVAGLVDRVLPDDAAALPAVVQDASGRPLLLSDVDDDIAYYGVLDGAPAPGRFGRFLRRAVPQRLPAG